MTQFAEAADVIVAAGNRLDRSGFAPATAGNYSMRLDDGSLAITVSGAHKGRLNIEQVMRVSPEGESLDGKKPSAETLLHCLIYAVDPAARAVLHTHSVPGVVLSRTLADADAIVLSDYELLKIYPGIDSHDARVTMPLVENSQDMKALAATLRPLLTRRSPPLPAFYIRAHGLYAWGASMAAAEMIAEGSEYLLACEWELTKAQGHTR